MYPSSRASKILNLALEQKNKCWGTYNAEETEEVVTKKKRKYDPFAIENSDEETNNCTSYRKGLLSDEISLTQNVTRVMSYDYNSGLGTSMITIHENPDQREVEEILNDNNIDELGDNQDGEGSEDGSQMEENEVILTETRSEVEGSMLDCDNDGNDIATDDVRHEEDVQPKSSKKERGGIQID